MDPDAPSELHLYMQGADYGDVDELSSENSPNESGGTAQSTEQSSRPHLGLPSARSAKSSVSSDPQLSPTR